MQKENRSSWMLVASMFIFGTISPFVRRISVFSGELALYRAILAALMIGMFIGDALSTGSSVGAIIGGVIGIAVALVIVLLTEGIRRRSPKWQPQLVRVIPAREEAPQP